MMVAPKAPEGGWRKWFLEHPHQRTRYPILRAEGTTAIYTQEYPESIPTPSFEFVEMWWNGSERRVYASLNGGFAAWLWFDVNSSNHSWDDGVRDLFYHCLAKETTPTPPEPSGSGWDDFDWSR